MDWMMARIPVKNEVMAEKIEPIRLETEAVREGIVTDVLCNISCDLTMWMSL